MNKQITQENIENKEGQVESVAQTAATSEPVSEVTEPTSTPTPTKQSTEKKNMKDPKEEVKVETKKSFVPETIVEESGINLIPTMSQEEIKQDEKKKKMSASALASISILFSVSILVIGFNIISKIQLNAEKDKLYAHEKKIEGYNQVIIDNSEIIERVLLYKDIQEGKFSTKAVIDYIQSIAKKSGSSKLTEFSFAGSSVFSFSGEASDLEDVAKLWYLLTNDLQMDNINLKSVSKSEEGTRFSFTGELRLDQFVNSTNN